MMPHPENCRLVSADVNDRFRRGERFGPREQVPWQGLRRGVLRISQRCIPVLCPMRGSRGARRRQQSLPGYMTLQQKKNTHPPPSIGRGGLQVHKANKVPSPPPRRTLDGHRDDPGLADHRIQLRGGDDDHVVGGAEAAAGGRAGAGQHGAGAGHPPPGWIRGF